MSKSVSQKGASNSTKTEDPIKVFLQQIIIVQKTSDYCNKWLDLAHVHGNCTDNKTSQAARTHLHATLLFLNGSIRIDDKTVAFFQMK